MTVERKYRMIRLSAGDYLLPGNDGETIFRIAKYVEDGISLEGVKGEFWAAWRWPKPKATLLRDPVYGYNPTEDWDAWYQIEDQFKTRQEAIDAALAWEWRRDNPIHGPERESVDVAAAVVAMFGRDA